MIGEIKTFTHEGESYELIKGGVSNALEIQGIFSYLVSRSGIDLSQNVKDGEFELALQSALDEHILEKIKNIIIRHVNSPVLTSAKYEMLDIDVITPLFMEIFHFHTERALKKKGNTKE